ncbi:MAG: TonB-dependent receptor, partial [Acidobacteria bacterium]|nr:TonB-dependent receptor [Acidobacteriota bacterium]
MTLTGFQTYAQTGIVLQVGDAPEINVVLRVSQLQEAVTVEAAVPLVDLRNPSLGRVVDSREVQALPLEARNPTQLIVLAGAAIDTGTPSSRSMTTSRAIVIAGGQSFGVTYSLDGAAHNNAFDGLNLPLPFPDALQEFRVETSSQNAQSGVHAAGTVSAVTKSGTNRFAGNVFEFARHHRFNATSPFAGRDPRTGERVSDGLVRNQFGATLGGPLLRDRLFFFGAHQATRATQTPADIITFVPTAAMLAGDFTQVTSAQCVTRGALTLRAPFVNNRIDPALLSPAAVAIAKRLPTTDDPCGRITYSRKTRPREGQSVARMDWQLTQNQTLFGRYLLTTTSWEPPYAETGNILASTLGGRDSDAHSLAVGHTAVLSNTMVNSLRLSVNRTNVHRTHEDFLGPQDVGVNVYSYPGRVMLITVTGGFSLGTGTEIDSYYRPNTYAVSDDLTLVRGNHQWGLGASVALSDWTALSNVRSSGTFSFNGGAAGLGLADFLLGEVFEFRQGTPFLMDISQKSFGLYGQDTWKVSPRVTLNYGVRWEPWFPQRHDLGRIYNFDAARFLAGQRSSVYPQAPPGLTYPGDEGFPGKSGMDKNWWNFQPRVGVAWDPRGDGRTSVRAAYAMNNDFISGGFYFDMARVPPFDVEERLTRPAVGRLDDPWGGVGRTNPYPVTLRPDMPFSPGVAYISVPPDLDTTRVHSWNVGVQQQVGANMAVSASYLGNYLMNAWGDVTGNPGVFPAGSSPTGPCTLNTATGPRTYANCSQAPLNLRREVTQANPAVGDYIGYLDWFTDEGWQRYHGLMLSFQRRTTSGLSSNVNYTVSTCEGLLVNQGAGPTNPGTGYLLPVSILNAPA